MGPKGTRSRREPGRELELSRIPSQPARPPAGLPRPGHRLMAPANLSGPARPARAPGSGRERTKEGGQPRVPLTRRGACCPSASSGAPAAVGCCPSCRPRRPPWPPCPPRRLGRRPVRPPRHRPPAPRRPGGGGGGSGRAGPAARGRARERRATRGAARAARPTDTGAPWARATRRARSPRAAPATGGGRLCPRRRRRRSVPAPGPRRAPPTRAHPATRPRPRPAVRARARSPPPADTTFTRTHCHAPSVSILSRAHPCTFTRDPRTHTRTRILTCLLRTSIRPSQSHTYTCTHTPCYTHAHESPLSALDLRPHTRVPPGITVTPGPTLYLTPLSGLPYPPSFTIPYPHSPTWTPEIHNHSMHLRTCTPSFSHTLLHLPLGLTHVPSQSPRPTRAPTSSPAQCPGSTNSPRTR